MNTSPLFADGQTSDSSETSRQRSGSETGASLWILDVSDDDGSWNGTLTVQARALGAQKDGSGVYTGPITIRNRADDTVIPGATGITAAGLYEVNIAGLEVALEHTRTAGRVRVRDMVTLG